MSLDIVEKQIINFLESETARLLVIRGKWGVGRFADAFRACTKCTIAIH
jgi:hypothetical protein